MADKTETLLFLVDVQVRNANALRELDADLDAAVASQQRRLLALQDVSNGTADSHKDLAAAMREVNGNGGTNGAVIPNGSGNGNGRTVIVSNGGGGGSSPNDTALVGIRGPHRPGSRENPPVVVLESGEAAGLGGLAAATGATSADRGPTPVAVAPTAEPASASPTSTEKSWLAQAAQAVAQKVQQPEQDRVIQAIQSASELHRAVSGGESNPLLLAAAAVQQASSAPDQQTLMSQLAGILAGRAANMPGRMLSTAETASRLGVHPSTVYYLAGSGQLPGAAKQGGAWQIPEQAVTDMLAAQSGGGGGGIVPPIPVGRGGGGGGNNNNNFWQRLLWGTGAFGLAGLGTVGSLAGFGPEHIVMTGAGLLGSLAGAGLGAGLLGLGAAGVAGVGMGTDMAGIGQAANDTKSVVQAQNSLNQAIAVYGKNSTQAQQAQAQLNATLNSFSPIAKSAVLQAANTAQAFHQMFNAATGEAEKTGAQILTQTMQVGEKFLPTIGTYAAENMKIIQAGIQPLFNWLTGPEGMGIFTNLEQEFQQRLPTAIQMGTQAFELLARIMDLASQDTGGFMATLDKLFTRLNSESNIQLDQEIQKLIGDFELWKKFVDALIIDVARLFSNDVGTGASIVSELTQMLDKLGQWENSVNGRQSLMTIFTVHKTEVDQLLHVIPLLFNAFAPVYMTLAPAMTGAFNDVAKAVLAVVSALEKIPGGTWLVGLTLIASKLGVIGSAMRLLTQGLAGPAAVKAAGAVGATGLAEGGAASGVAAGAAGGAAAGLLAKIGATGAGSAISGGVESAALGLGGAAEGAGLEGVAGAITAAGAAIAPVAAGLIPLLAAAGGVYGLVQLFGLFSQNSAVTTSYNSNQLATLLQQKGKSALTLPATPAHPTVTVPPSLGRGGALASGAGATSAAGPTISQIGQTSAAKNALQSFVNTTSSQSTLGNMDVSQLQGLVKEGQALAQIFPQDSQVIDKFTARVQADLKPLAGLMQSVTSGWYIDVDRNLAALYDDFDTHTRRIATVVGLNSAQGKQAMAANVQQMIAALSDGMQNGTIKVTAGMAAIKTALDQGMKDDAIGWQTDWTDMFQVVTGLYDAHKISTQTYLSDLKSMNAAAFADITASNKSELDKQLSDLRTEQQQGLISQGQYNAQKKKLEDQSNSQSAADELAFVGNLANSMKQAGTATAAGMALIGQEVNKALKALGEPPIDFTSISSSPGAGGASLSTLEGISNAAAKAVGGLIQIGQPGQAGQDSVPLNVGGTPIRVAPGEQVAVFNRHQLPIVNAALAGYGGLSGLFQSVPTPHYMAGGGMVPGFAGGGYVYPYGALSPERIDQGKDFGGSGPVGALGPGTVVESGLWPGWPGTGGMVYRLTSGSRAGYNVYNMEDFAPSVGYGASVTAGEIIGRATGGPSGIEAGWANASATGPLTPYPHPEAGPQPGGIDFANFIAALSGGQLTGSALTGMALAAVIPHITAPGVKGPPALAALVRGALGKTASAANAYLSSLAPTGGTAGISGAGLSGSLTQIVQQISAEKGWNAQDWLGVISLESGGSMTAKNPSSGAYGIAQFINGASEYYNYGGNPDTEVGQLTAMANYIAERYGNPTAALAHEHAYHWYAQGGLLPMMFAPGGTVPTGGASLSQKQKQFVNAHKGNGKKKAPAPKKPKPLSRLSQASLALPSSSVLGTGGPFPFDTSDLDPIRAALNAIFGLDGGQGGTIGQGGDAQTMSELIQMYTGLWGAQAPSIPGASDTFASYNSPSSFVITTNAQGQTVNPYISPNLSTVLQELGGPGMPNIIGYQTELVGDLASALADASALAAPNGPLQAAINRRAAEVAQITQRIKANVAKIKQLQKNISDTQKKITAEKAKKAPYAKPKTKAQTAANNAFNQQRNQKIQQWNAQISGWQAQITQLEGQNNQLGGSKDAVGTGGELATIQAQLGTPATTGPIALAEGAGSGATGLYGLLANVDSWVTQLGSPAGDLYTQQLQLTEYQQAYKALAPGANVALEAAITQGNPLAANPMTGSTAFSYQGQYYTASLNGLMDSATQALNAVANLPYAGSFASGGIVPGAWGQPMLATVHGGEEISGLAPRVSPQTGNMTAAIDRLTAAMCSHEQTLKANTQAISANTQATTSSTGGAGTTSSYTSLASDTFVNLGVGG